MLTKLIVLETITDLLIASICNIY